MSEELVLRVRRALDEVRPGLRADGGDVDLISVDGDVVTLRLRGACQGCPMAGSTLSEFVTERIRVHAPEIRRVIAV